jgi:hypothetical protein
MENYLKDIHAENYTGTDDDMPDAFDSWIQDLDVDTLIAYADEYADKRVENVKKEIEEYFKGLIFIPNPQATQESLLAIPSLNTKTLSDEVNEK